MPTTSMPMYEGVIWKKPFGLNYSLYGYGPYIEAKYSSSNSSYRQCYVKKIPVKATSLLHTAKCKYVLRSNISTAYSASVAFYCTSVASTGFSLTTWKQIGIQSIYISSPNIPSEHSTFFKDAKFQNAKSFGIELRPVGPNGRVCTCNPVYLQYQW